MDYFWNLFMNTGNPLAYLLYKELNDEIEREKEDGDI